LVVDASKFNASTGTWEDPNKVGSAGHSGGGLWITYDNVQYIVGNFHWANATGETGRAGIGQKVGGTILTKDSAKAIETAIRALERNWHLQPRDLSLASDDSDTGDNAIFSSFAAHWSMPRREMTRSWVQPETTQFTGEAVRAN
jgi:hypothetical protein